MLSDKNFTIDEFNKNNQISIDVFYRDYVSQSIPVVFRGEAADTQLAKTFDNLNDTELNDFLLESFSMVSDLGDGMGLPMQYSSKEIKRSWWKEWLGLGKNQTFTK